MFEPNIKNTFNTSSLIYFFNLLLCNQILFRFFIFLINMLINDTIDLTVNFGKKR